MAAAKTTASKKTTAAKKASTSKTSTTKKTTAKKTSSAKKTTAKKTSTAKKSSSTQLKLSSEEKKLIQNYRKCNTALQMVLSTATAKFAESGASGSTSSSGLSLDSLLEMLGK